MKRKRNVVFLGLTVFVLIFLEGCSQMLLLDPKGPIGEAERFVIITAFMLMMIVVIPVFVMVFWFSRRYRASNTQATYAPKWSYSAKIDLVVWLVPVAIVTALGVLTWRMTHHLAPTRPIDTGVKPVRIQAVSLDWKWLFIYPDHHIAVVNQLVFPTKVPLSFRITSDSVMTSFFIPQLGSQIYAMAGRQTRLHLMADEPGTYSGHNQQFSGPGYSEMHFKAMAVSRKEFDAWVQKVKQSPNRLDRPRFAVLKKPSIGYPVTLFSSVTPGLFEYIINQYTPGSLIPGAVSRISGSIQRKTDALEEK